MSNSAQPDPRSQDPDWAPAPRAHVQYSKPAKQAAQGEDQQAGDNDEEEEEDEYEKRIARTGCAAENEALQMCYAEKHDWRACKDAMTAFRDCWKRNGNVQAEV
ncbi:hypothetical protein BGZ99_007978 [Dissophora globulifera]|uniref:CHCH domain-containing protein n=1 Tax=Dissophora globulifera TaxID=979702 RepID=A0A9P6RX34_9FUNG|nr:hypothetical protein BGZ99_007978 [Dissophora globulifera]